MISLSVEGTTRRIGKSQGYLGLSIRDDTMPDRTSIELTDATAIEGPAE